MKTYSPIDMSRLVLQLRGNCSDVSAMAGGSETVVKSRTAIPSPPPSPFPVAPVIASKMLVLARPTQARRSWFRRGNRESCARAEDHRSAIVMSNPARKLKKKDFPSRTKFRHRRRVYIDLFPSLNAKSAIRSGPHRT